MGLLVRLFICIFTAGSLLYLYLDKQNDVMQLYLAIPPLAREVRQLNEQNTRLRYKLERFENPINLLKLSHQPEFSYLKNPSLEEVVIIPFEDNYDKQ
ncbi:MAG: hypothetical protein ACQEP8_02220 [Chlamydiota bacterium]